MEFCTLFLPLTLPKWAFPLLHPLVWQCSPSLSLLLLSPLLPHPPLPPHFPLCLLSPLPFLPAWVFLISGKWSRFLRLHLEFHSYWTSEIIFLIICTFQTMAFTALQYHIIYRNHLNLEQFKWDGGGFNSVILIVIFCQNNLFMIPV